MSPPRSSRPWRQLLGKTRLISNHSFVDPDALNQLMASLLTVESGRPLWKLVFTYHECKLEIQADGRISVEPLADIDHE